MTPHGALASDAMAQAERKENVTGIFLDSFGLALGNIEFLFIVQILRKSRLKTFFQVEIFLQILFQALLFSLSFK